MSDLIFQTSRNSPEGPSHPCRDTVPAPIIAGPATKAPGLRKRLARIGVKSCSLSAFAGYGFLQCLDRTEGFHLSVVCS